jgi:hypothetical protein
MTFPFSVLDHGDQPAPRDHLLWHHDPASELLHLLKHAVNVFNFHKVLDGLISLPLVQPAHIHRAALCISGDDIVILHGRDLQLVG